MVTLKNAEAALKTVYLSVVTDQLNSKVNPLFSLIKQSDKDVWGKEVRKLVRFGLPGGIGAGDEDSELPTPKGNSYVQFVASLKNLYGQMSITDKAIRASQSSEGAFVNLLNDEMEGLLKAARLNLGRMLYGDGSGIIAYTVGGSAFAREIPMLNATRVMPGMVVDFYKSDKTLLSEALVVESVKYGPGATSVIFTEPVAGFDAGSFIVARGSYNKELTGLKAIMNESRTELYGVDKTSNTWMNPISVTCTGALDEITIQGLLDKLQDDLGSDINALVMTSGVRRNYMKEMMSYRRNIDVMNLETGYKTISFNGIPMIADRFCESNTLYALNTGDFCLHQLCDWKWLENENGNILHKDQGRPTYTATLVKYAELICARPNGQGKIIGINEN